MTRELILGTAGHIDHGKTALVKALTGVDCDRLPEEKSRGITIDIGFAELDLGEYRLGIVDVPGHERFIKNMLAGATGIDLALLAVAADDSVMPQTREHLEILKLLGIHRGVIAVTKCDLVDATVREVVAQEIRELVADSFLAEAPIVFTSVHKNEGLEQLRAALTAACANLDSRFPTLDSRLPFRLSIDRSFVMQGHGTVVTGTVASGSVKVGDEVEWLPRGDRVRVRSLQHHGKSVSEVHRGMRAAINLAGVDHGDIHRGQELAKPGYLIPSRTLTSKIQVSPDARRPMKHRTPVRLHIGTGEVMGVVSLLDADALAPGQSGYAQLFLDEPVMAVWNQPFVLRDSSAESTMGGGRVLQPVARKTRRHDPVWLECLTRSESADVKTRMDAVAWSHGTAGFDDADLIRDAGVLPEVAVPLVAELVRDGQLLALDGHRHLHTQVLSEMETRIANTLIKWHVEQPLLANHERAKVIAQFEYLGDATLVSRVIDHMLARKKLVGDARRIARTDFKPKLTANQQKLIEKIVAGHAAAPFQPPDPASFVPPGTPTVNLSELCEVAVAQGQLVKIGDGMYLHADAAVELRKRVQKALKDRPAGLTVADIRDFLGTTRKYAVPICEYLDRVGITKRIGDLRVDAQDLPVAGE